MVNFNTAINPTGTQAQYTWRQILGRPGLYRRVDDDSFVMLIPKNATHGVVIMENGEVVETLGEWDGGKFVDFEGSVTIGPVTS